MREFILRARKAPTAPTFSLDALPDAGHLEIVAACIANALFTSNHLREDTAISVVLEGGPDPPRTLRIDGGSLGSLDGFDERSIASMILRALDVGCGLALHESRDVDGGITIAKRAFEHLVRDLPSDRLFYLSRRGRDIRGLDLPADPVFVLSDHIALPKKSAKHLDRLGATPVSLGPRTLFASHCVVLVHNELDRRDAP